MVGAVPYKRESQRNDPTSSHKKQHVEQFSIFEFRAEHYFVVPRFVRTKPLRCAGTRRTTQPIERLCRTPATVLRTTLNAEEHRERIGAAAAAGIKGLHHTIVSSGMLVRRVLDRIEPEDWCEHNTS